MKVLIMTTVLLFAGQAFGRPHMGMSAFPNSLMMSCEQTQSLVQVEGAVVISTGEYVGDRYVLHAGYCVGGEIAKATWIETADEPYCHVGYTCSSRKGPRD